ncbi:MAG: hypothetical protein SO062_04635, partial [Sodaliphilus sp.]|nr:hypothetical protein [Sodaliphilus sp.]
MIRGICGFKASHKLSTNSHELFVGKMVCFSIILHTFAYIRLKKPSCHDNQYTTSPHQKTANQNRWGAHAVLLWLYAGWGAV